MAFWISSSCALASSFASLILSANVGLTEVRFASTPSMTARRPIERAIRVFRSLSFAWKLFWSDSVVTGCSFASLLVTIVLSAWAPLSCAAATAPATSPLFASDTWGSDCAMVAWYSSVFCPTTMASAAAWPGSEIWTFISSSLTEAISSLNPSTAALTFSSFPSAFELVIAFISLSLRPANSAWSFARCSPDVESVICACSVASFTG